MSNSTADYYELTGKTKIVDGGVILHRIRATRDLDYHGVEGGDLGGWIESTGNLWGNGWVARGAQVFGGARVYDYARISGRAQVFGGACVRGHAIVTYNARVYDHALVNGSARIYDDSQVYGHAYVRDNAVVEGFSHVHDKALLRGNARICGSGRVTSIQDVLTLGPIGSEHVIVNLFRSQGGHTLTVGCWTGTIDTLMAEVDSRAEATWHEAEQADRDRWRAEYAALVPLLQARAEYFAHEDH